MNHNNQTLDNFGLHIETTTEALSEYSKLIGTTTTNETLETICNRKAGLNMDIDAKMLHDLSESVRRGIFQVMIMGTFKNGKSTLLNSIIGIKVLPSRVIACTAIITIIVYGKNKDVVTVYYKNGKEPKQMSIAEFNSNYKLNMDDQVQIQKDGYLDKFIDVDYAIIETDSPICKNGVQIVDSPGLEERKSASDVTNNYIPKANAIIYALNAIALFNKNDREYIRKNFVKEKSDNVFFVVNRFDQIEESDKDDIINATRETLKTVFTDKNGVFDKELYNQRVFFTNAQGALEAKIDGDYSKYSSSGVASFERSLETFLLSDSKMMATFASSLNVMSQSYTKALTVMEQDIIARERPLSDLQGAKTESDEIIEAQIAKRESLKKKFKATAQTVYLKLSHSLKSYVETMKRTWDSDVENIEIKGFGFWSAVKTIFANEEKKQELMKPISEAVEKYIREKIETWKYQAHQLVEDDIEMLSEETKEFVENFDIEISKAVDKFIGRSTKSGKLTSNKFNTLQAITGLLIGDASVTVCGALGLYSWGNFITKIITNVLITMGVILVFGNIAGIIIIIIESLQIYNAGNVLQDKILNSIKDELFEELSKNLNSNEDKLKDEIAASFEEQYEIIGTAVTTVITQVQNSQNEIIDDIESGKSNIEEEKKRHMAIKNRLKELISSVYKIVKGEDMNDDNFQVIISNSN